MQPLKSIIFCLLVFAIAHAGIINVPADQATIQEGINAAVDGDTVLVAEGTYYENINYNGKAITVASHFAVDGDTTHIANTIIDGSQATNSDSASVVLFVSGEDTTSVLTGFKITGGAGTDWVSPQGDVYSAGGGVYINKSSARIVNNLIAGNAIQSDSKPGEGGGVDAEADGADVLIIIEDNVISDNLVEVEEGSAEAGGLGIYAPSRIRNNLITSNKAAGKTVAAAGALAIGMGEQAHLINNTITNNISSALGDEAPYAVTMAAFAKLEISGNVIAHNNTLGTAGSIGNGLYVFLANPGSIIRDNKISENRYNRQHFLSKAILISRSLDVLVENNIITENKNTGGIHLDQSSAVIRGNSITDNSAYYATGISGFASKMLFENNVVARNIGNTGSGGGWLMNMESALLQNNLFYENNAMVAAAGGLAVGKVETQQAVQLAPPALPVRYAAVANAEKSVRSESSQIPDLGAVVLMHNTVCDNKAGNYGGGLFVYNWETYSINNILWGNTAGKDGAQIWDPYNTLQVLNCDVQDGWEKGTGIIVEDPLFIESSYFLSEYSQCIGAGLASYTVNGVELKCSGNDCNGRIRPLPAGSMPDIGAIESALAHPRGASGLASKDHIPISFKLAQNYPNPFNPSTTIEYTLPQPAQVSLSVYNLRGQIVCELIDEEQSAGAHAILWRGEDERGAQVSSGVYIYRLRARDAASGEILFNNERKMALMR